MKSTTAVRDVSSRQAGSSSLLRLGRAVQARTPGISFTRAKKAVEAGEVTVDGIVVDDPGAIVAAESEIVWDPERKRVAVRGVEILHADADVAVVLKPAGLLTQPTLDREKETLLSRVSTLLTRREGKRPFLAVVQRLDKETSGVLVFARSRRAQHGLQKQLTERSVERVYEALVEGVMERNRGSFEAPLAGDGTHAKRGVAKPGVIGRVAITHWEVLERFRRATRVRVRLETGRTHQIRIHFAAAQRPVLGDRVYGGRGTKSAPRLDASRLALHAARLGFRHPGDGRWLVFEAPPPTDYLLLADRLRKEEAPR